MVKYSETMDPSPSLDSCRHEWQRDLWKSAYAGFRFDPALNPQGRLLRPGPVPLEGCLKCGAIRVIRASSSPAGAGSFEGSD